MTMQGQPHSGEPGEGELSLDSLANQLEPEQPQDESSEGEEGADESDVEQAEGEQPDEADEGEEGDEPTFTITHDGKEVNVKQSEALALAQKGLDYTRKTMALAEERKALEPVKQQVEQLRQHHEAALNETVGRLRSVVDFMTAELGDPPPVEWASQDAGYYIAQKEQYESRKGKLEKAQHALQASLHEQARQRQALIAQTITETQAELKRTLPDWDHAKEDALAKYVASNGLTPDKSEMAFWKAGFWQMAQKAKAYDELQAKKAELKPVSSLPKVHKPTANNQPPQLAKRQEAMKRHKQAPSISTLAALL